MTVEEMAEMLRAFDRWKEEAGIRDSSRADQWPVFAAGWQAGRRS